MTLAHFPGPANQTIAPLVPGDTMAQIHVWKSNLALRAKSPREQRTVLAKLTSLLKVKIDSGQGDQDGPFVVQSKDDYLIIWTDRSGRRGHVVHDAPAVLSQQFSPMLTVSASGKRTAKAFADKLSD